MLKREGSDESMTVQIFELKQQQFKKFTLNQRDKDGIVVKQIVE